MIKQDELKKILFYDPLTGVLHWRINKGKRICKGNIAGVISSEGYVIITYNRISYLAHRLAFLYMEGYFPEYLVDHKNRRKADNRWKNLRHATPVCNAQNQKLRSSNKSGFTGVAYNKASGKWLAYAKVLKHRVSLGSHSSAEEAALARLTFEDQCSDWICSNDDTRKKLRLLGYNV